MRKKRDTTPAKYIISPVPGKTALQKLFGAAESAQDYAAAFQDRMARLIAALDSSAIAELIELLEQTCESGGGIFAAGNGGSSAVASHFVVDLASNALVDGFPGYRVMCLSDNVESMTAIANDSGYENVFSRQIRCHLRPGDVLIAFSVSGNSENVVRAVEMTKLMGGTAVGLTGFDGGRLREICDLSVHIPATRDEYGPVEDAFSCVTHIVTGYLTMKRGRMLSH